MARHVPKTYRTLKGVGGSKNSVGAEKTLFPTSKSRSSLIDRLIIRVCIYDVQTRIGPSDSGHLMHALVPCACSLRNLEREHSTILNLCLESIQESESRSNSVCSRRSTTE